MLEIVFNNVKRNFGYKDVLDGLSFEVLTGDRMAIIGTNGSGKTTALKIIAGKERIDSGLITIRSGATIGYLQQANHEINVKITVNDFIKTGQKECLELERKLQELTKEMEDPKGGMEQLLSQYDRAQNTYIAKGGYELEESFNKICTGCKITKDLLEKNYGVLSGGEQTIVSVARILYGNPDILLLDEPTNHLDIQTTEWLEDFIKKYHGTVILVSHDRYFIDRVATKTLLIEDGKAHLYHGNYSYFLEEDERRTLAQFDHYKNQQKQIEAMKSSIKQLREFGNRSGNEKFFKRAASIQKRLEKMDIIEKPTTIRALSLDFELKNRSGKDVIAIEELNLTIGGRTLIEDGSINIYYGDKVCILGKNGAGKSTLLKAILGHLSSSVSSNQIVEPSPSMKEYLLDATSDKSGSIDSFEEPRQMEAPIQFKNITKSQEVTPVEVTASKFKVGESVKIGYISQEITFNNEANSILKIFQDYCVGTETLRRTKLSRFRFVGEDVFKKVGSLSGGERVKLRLACLMEQEVNCIILDEPTNHIDIDTREVLEDALKDYKGTLIFVTHDRYFTNTLAKKIIAIVECNVTTFVGNYDDYKASQN